MPLKCQFCGQESVVEDDFGDGRDQLICIECGSEATQTTTTTEQVDASNSAILKCADQDIESVCQSCGESLTAEETKYCSECHALEDECVQPGVENNIASKLFSSGPGQCHPGDGLSPHSSMPEEEKSSSTPVCISCKSHDLVLDCVGVEEKMVCRSCGHVVGGDMLTTDEPEENSTRTFGNSIKTLPKYSGKKAGETQGIKAGMERISLVYHKLVLSRNIKEDAERIFSEVIYLSCVYCTKQEYKEHLAVACVYLACRKNNIPISLIHLTDYITNMKLFTRAKKLIMQAVKLDIPLISLGAQVYHICEPLTSKMSKSSAKEICIQVRDMMFLCRRAWLLSGRANNLIYFSLYFAYLASDECTEHISYVKFCKKFNVPSFNASQRKHFKDLFLRLGNSLPWVKSGQVKYNTLHLHIADILKYKNSLIHFAFETPEPGKECKPWEKDSASHRVGDSKSTGSQHGYCDGKGILLPPSFKRARMMPPMACVPEPVIPEGLDLDNPEIKPTDFPEEEIDSYLLPKDQIESVRPEKEKLFRKVRPKGKST